MIDVTVDRIGEVLARTSYVIGAFHSVKDTVRDPQSFFLVGRILVTFFFQNLNLFVSNQAEKTFVSALTSSSLSSSFNYDTCNLFRYVHNIEKEPASVNRFFI